MTTPVRTVPEGTIELPETRCYLRPTGKPNRYNVFAGGAYVGDALRIITDQGPDDWRLFYRVFLPDGDLVPMSRDFSGSGELRKFLTTGEGGW